MKRTLILTTSIVSLFAAAAPAFAQQADDEIIVTATKRAQSIQDVPIAVTVVTPKQLEDQGVVNIQDLASVAPSFSSTNAQTSSGTVVLRMRGVGTTSNNIGFESAVGVFIDGIYQSRAGVALGEFVDVAQVEVLRGPQGTLFGRNTSAGALSVTNVRPDLDEYSGFVNASVGDYNLRSLQGAVNIPMAEGKVAARITAAIRERDGFIDVVDRTGASLGETNEVDQFMVRGQIGFETPKGIEGRVILDYSNSDASCCGSVEVLQSSVETNNLFALTGLGLRGGQAGTQFASGPYDEAGAVRAMETLLTTANQVQNSTSDQRGVSLELDIPVSDNIDATYIGSFRDYAAENDYDSDFSGLDVFNVLPGSPTEIQTITHELRFDGKSMDDRLDWLVGGYYSDETIDQTQTFGLGTDYDRFAGALLAGSLAANGATGASVLAFSRTPYLTLTGFDPATSRAKNKFNQDSQSWSLFTHNIFSLTDAFDLTVGLRYSDESKDGSFVQSQSTNPVCPATANALGGLGGTVVGAGVAPANARGVINTVFGLGCFAFTAPADLPQAAGLPLPTTFDGTFEDDELIYTGKLSYKMSPYATGYASFTHGYKSGGFNLDSTGAIPVNGVSDPRFDSELVDAYEVGLKTKLFDNRVALNAAAFYQEFTNFQVLEFTGAQFQTFNVPKAETTGLEIEANGRVTDNLSLNGGLTLLDAKYPDDCATSSDAVRVQNLCGFSLTNAPDTVGIFGAKYEGDLGSNFNFFLAGQARYESDRRTSTQGRNVPNAAAVATAGSVDAAFAASPLTALDIQEANTKINLRAGIGNEAQGWGLEVWGTNVTDEITRGVTTGTPIRQGSRMAFVQQPAMYGVTARKNF